MLSLVYGRTPALPFGLGKITHRGGVREIVNLQRTGTGLVFLPTAEAAL